MSRLKRHLAKPIKKEFVNADGEKDVFIFKPISVKYLPKLMGVMRSISKSGMMKKDFENLSEKEQAEKTLDVLSEETTDKLISLVKNMCHNSFPDEDSDAIDAFISAHFNELIGILFEVNSYESKKKDTKPEKKEH